MPAAIHARAEHLLAKNPDMKKSTAFAVATQQMEALGKTPKGYGTAEGKRTAKAKYNTPGDDVKTPNPGNLETPKLKAATIAAFVDELEKISMSPNIEAAGAVGGILRKAQKAGKLEDVKNTGAWHQLGRYAAKPDNENKDIFRKLHNRLTTFIKEPGAVS
jgi:hypothetical protein